jgi:hypothetical protein
MKLKDALEQVEREQPHLTGSAKIQAIKELRDKARTIEKPAVPIAQPKPPGRKSNPVRKAWRWLLVLTCGMAAIGFIAWDSAHGLPSWFPPLAGFQMLWAVGGVVSAYRKQADNGKDQRPV